MAAGISIFTLMGSVLVDNDKANESIQKTDSLAEKLGKGLANGTKTAAKWGAAIGGAALAGGTALFAMANKSADTTDRIDKLSQKIGISRKDFQELEYILSQNGTSIEKLQVGLKTMTERMHEAETGTGKGAEAFKRLQLDAVDPLTGSLKTQEQMFDETAKALMELPEGAEKSKLAFDLFGKAGLELMPLLNGTAEDMDGLRQAANDMGLVLSDESVAAGAAFTDMKDNVTRSLGAVVANIGVEVMPMFMTLFDWIMDHMPEIQAIMKVVFEKIGEFVNVAIDVFVNYLLPVLQSIFEWTQEHMPEIQRFFEISFGIMKGIVDGVIDAIKSLTDFFTKHWDVMEPIFIGIAAGAATFGIYTLAINSVAIATGIWTTVTTLATTATAALGAAIAFITSPIGIIVLAIGALVAIGVLLYKNWEEITGFVNNQFNAAMEGVGKAVEAVTKIFTGFIDGIKSAWEWLTKWNKTDVKDKDAKVTSGGVRIDGRHQSGLAYVPFDNYTAELHKGERVLTAQENKEYMQGGKSEYSPTFNIYSKTMTPAELMQAASNQRKIDKLRGLPV